MLSAVVQTVLDENQQVAQDFRNGKDAALQFLIGRVMAGTKGKGNPQVIRTLLLEKLKQP